MKLPHLLQRRFVWNVGQWPLLTALISLFLFWGGGWIVALPLAAASLVFGLQCPFTLYSVSAVVVSVVVLLFCAFFLTPLYYLLNP